MFSFEFGTIFKDTVFLRTRLVAASRTTKSVRTWMWGYQQKQLKIWCSFQDFLCATYFESNISILRLIFCLMMWKKKTKSLCYVTTRKVLHAFGQLCFTFIFLFPKRWHILAVAVFEWALSHLDNLFKVRISV